jgi:hypothetical protein
MQQGCRMFLYKHLYMLLSKLLRVLCVARLMRAIIILIYFTHPITFPPDQDR